MTSARNNLSQTGESGREEPKLPRAVILTALPVEFEAVCAHLINRQEEVHAKGTVYQRGLFVGSEQSWEVLVVETGAGNVEAGIEAERAINYFDPIAIFFVGVAGGIKDVEIGDVVAATKVYGYESGVERESFEPRPNVGESSYLLEQRSRAEAKKQDWLSRIDDSIIGRIPKAFVGAIAAGEKVLKSTSSAVYEFLRSHYGDALAVEMEGRGFLNAARANSVHALVVRGISDLLNKKEEADAGGSQEIAAQNASAFAFEVLAKLIPIVQTIGSGLNLIDRFREVTLSAFDQPQRETSVRAVQVDDALQIEERGEVLEKIEEKDLKLNEWDDTRYKALEKRVKSNWKTYNEIYGALPDHAVDEQIRLKRRMETIKEELCTDFQEMIRIYERTLKVSLNDHYTLYEVCGIKFMEQKSASSGTQTANSQGAQSPSSSASSASDFTQPSQLISPVDQFDEYLLDSGNARRARRLVMEETTKLHASLNDQQFPVIGTPFSYELVVRRMHEYESLVHDLESLFILGCHDGGHELAGGFAEALSHIANPPGASGSSDTLVKLKLYPALLLLYAGGIAAVAGEKYENLTALLRKALIRNSRHRKAVPASFALVPGRVIDHELANRLPEIRGHNTPINHHLYQVLREPLKRVLLSDDFYKESFVRFEYLFALASAAESNEQGFGIAAPVGSYAWTEQVRDPTQHITKETDHEVAKMKEDWLPLKAGLFDGSLADFIAFKKEADERILKNVINVFFPGSKL
jgi:nucleoside phosphorylase